MSAYQVREFRTGARIILFSAWVADRRGEATETFDAKWFAEHGMGPFDTEFISVSHRGVVRGLHYQEETVAPQTKLIQCVRGKVDDVVVDLRLASYGAVDVIRMDESDNVWLYVPSWCAHGFEAHAPDTTMIYKLKGRRDAAAERVILWNSVKAPWSSRTTDPILSDRDAQGIPLEDFRRTR